MLVWNKQLLHNWCWKTETYTFTGTWT